MYEGTIELVKDAYETPSIFGINFKKCSKTSGVNTVTTLGLENTCPNGADLSQTVTGVLAAIADHLLIYMAANSSDNSFS